MYNSRQFLYTIAACIVLVACQQHYVPQQVEYAGYAINVKDSSGQNLSRLLEPYKDSVVKLMDNVIGNLPVSLEKSLPDGTLGNFLADSYLMMAKQKYNPKASIAFMNHGGIRLNSIPAGPIKRGKVFEVMPFDNEMIIQDVTGEMLQEYLNGIAADGGGGVAGISFQIADKKAVNVLINGKPIEPAVKYTMVNSDYVVNGGGGYTGFRDLPKNKTGYLLRNAILDYINGFTEKNLPVAIQEDKRITSAN